MSYLSFILEGSGTVVSHFPEEKQERLPTETASGSWNTIPGNLHESIVESLLLVFAEGMDGFNINP